MPKYKLRRGFFDGARHYRAGEVVEVEKGKQPSTAIEVKEGAKAKEPEPEPKPEPELALEPDPLDAKPGDTLSSLGKKK